MQVSLKLSKIDAVLKPLSPDYFGAYMDNSIQLYHLLEWSLRQCGVSDVSIITFSLSEEFVRKIFKLRQEGLIRNTTIVLDLKAMQKTEKLIKFSENVFNQVSYAKVHAKVILIQSAKMNVCIVGSQNATRTSRLESIIITTKTDIFDTFYNKNIKAICNTLKNNSKQ